MKDLIERQAAIEDVKSWVAVDGREKHLQKDVIEWLKEFPSAQPQYEELTPEEAASEIASGSMVSARYWLDVTMRLKQMGYAICRERYLR